MSRHYLVVFTDLDGTLLDHETYSWEPARAALRELARHQVPIIFCTSKTRAEVEVLRRKLKVKHPFVTENGGGVFIPHRYFQRPRKSSLQLGKYECIALARPYSEVRQALTEAASRAGVKVVGFHRMSVTEIARVTGLSPREASRAKQRDFDEPFLVTASTPRGERQFVSLVRRRGLEVARGGRFWHLFGGSDKGRAVRILLAMFQKDERRPIRAVGLGDAANDLPMLAEVDIPILLPRPNGTFDPAVIKSMPNVRLGRAPGPKGWGIEILGIMRDHLLAK